MTEAEWLTCAEPQPMLEFLRGKASDRKLRLFACACCRHVWELLLDERSRKAVDFAEQYADGLISDEDLATTRNAALSARKAIRRTVPLAGSSPAFGAARAADTVVESSVESALAAVSWVSDAIARQAFSNREDFDDVYEAIEHFKMFHVCPLLRDILGNPFHSITVGHSWLTPTVINHAQSIYDDRAFDRMPILADALEEAGCTNADILTHCRGPGPHVRGCWVVDLLLANS